MSELEMKNLVCGTLGEPNKTPANALRGGDDLTAVQTLDRRIAQTRTHLERLISLREELNELGIGNVKLSQLSRVLSQL